MTKPSPAKKSGPVLPTDLHQDIAEALGWTVREAQQFSLASLRDLVRPINPSLADRISQTLAQGSHLTRRGKK